MESKPMPEANALGMMRLAFWAAKKYSYRKRCFSGGEKNVGGRGRQDAIIAVGA
jgi:hypothetical protein